MIIKNSPEISVLLSTYNNQNSIGSGKGNTIEELVSIIFEKCNLNYKEYIQENKHILRKNDPQKRICNPKKINVGNSWYKDV